MASLVLVFLKVAFLSAVAVALLAPLIGAALLPAIRKLAPERRAVVLLIACWLPVLGAVLGAAMVAGPSLTSAVGLATGHCPSGASASHHHCVLHAGTGIQLPGAGGWLMALGIGVAWLMGRNLLALVRERRSQRALIRMGRQSTSNEHLLMLPTDHRFAGVIGLLKPRVMLSHGLIGELSDEQRAVVEAHEAAHCARRDPLRLLLARFGALVHLPVVRRILLSEFLLATEQTADEHAAVAVGDRLRVADTILSVARLRPGHGGDLAFTGSVIDQRIEALATEPQSSRFHGALALSACAVLSTAALVSPVVHHALESLLSTFLG